MNLDIDHISENSVVALELTPWLKPLEKCEQLARQHAPWHLWLDKWSYPWAVRCDKALEHWQEKAKRTEDKGQKRVYRDKADSIPSGKTAALATAAALANQDSLAQHCRRTVAWLSALQCQHGVRFSVVELVLESRLLLHLGRANVLENVGLYADRTTGLPIIPGTALKGLLSTWACWANHFNSADCSFREFSKDSTQRHNFTAVEVQLAKQILGDDNASGSDHAGEVIFIGGFPVIPPRLGLDIVNPHYESDGREKTKLTPNAFLCVEPGTIWRFTFFVRPGAVDADKLIERTSCWIHEALIQVGIGAKTATGYGRFREPTEDDRAAEAKAAEQARAAEAAAAESDRKAAEKTQQQAAAMAAMASDYPNPGTFKSRVVDKLNPGQLDHLKSEVAILQKAGNNVQLCELKQILASKNYKDVRKRLRAKDWFPKEWLPPQ